ncbi:hybrid signal transduction histidine kinase M [Sabethes cyaneus]|uniref:hybrid signal transduction histidine kinase M n=1 Tax=Sabethes cyaneus TaxID=53552 RepID=UPI00237E9607|nr:hybrid signal transduction histidine kinase M [Sabethes cyaneus]
MAKDNNNINITEELTSGSNTPADLIKQSSRAEQQQQQQLESNSGRTNGVQMSHPDGNSDIVGATPDLPRREENPFSFKHFLKRDSSLGGGASSCNTTPASVGSNTVNINHSRSTSNINGNNNNGSSSNSTNFINGGNASCSNAGINSSAGNGASPSKSATTSSLHNTSTTGAKPKIPQFQSVNTLSSESKMKRSPRFPSFDSQSSLSDLADDKFMANIYHSRSNNSFNSDYPLGCGGSISGGSQYVHRSYSNYDMESPGSVDSPRLIGSQNLHNSPNFGGRSRENLTTHRLGASEFPAALPDFVQDHLVMEQWYNTMGSPKSVSPVSVDFEQLPDFTVNNLEQESSGSRAMVNDIPFDLTYGSVSAAGTGSVSMGTANRNRTPLRTSPNVPLDLPPQNSNFSFDLPRMRRSTPPQQQAPVPELPPDLTENSASGQGCGSRFGFDMDRNLSSPPPSSTADKIHRLPDFLSDGPIHSSGRLADVTHDTPHFNSPDADALQQLQRLQIERQENDRLRIEVDDNRRVIAEQARRIKDLEKALEATKNSATSAQGVEGIEENLDKSYLRAATAESQVIKLRQRIKRLNAEIEALRQENDNLKEEGAVGGADISASEGACGGAAGGSGGVTGNRNFGGRQPWRRTFSRAQELSRELRQAAASAENNLRQLLTGVDNLRMMASTIENIDRIDISHPEDFQSDSDDNDLLGPAL